MAFKLHRLGALAGLIGLTGGMDAASASAFLYWQKPDFAGAPVTGDESGIILPLPSATPAEIRAGLLWNLRAGLNVAALQCQFEPLLMTVYNYNDVIKHHANELDEAYKTLNGYFKRTGGPGWQSKMDQYTTRTYNGFSTLNAQLGFCETAASIGRDAIGRPRGGLHFTAENRMRELRNSLIPMQDRLYATRFYLAPRALPPLDAKCWDRKNRFNAKKCPVSMVSAGPTNPAIAAR